MARRTSIKAIIYDKKYFKLKEELRLSNEQSAGSKKLTTKKAKVSDDQAGEESSG